MNKPAELHDMAERDRIQDLLAGYAHGIEYAWLSPATIHAAKVRIIDTLAATLGGFSAQPCVQTRNLAGRLQDPEGATLIGTRTRCSPDMAAYANATASRIMEMNDCYHGPGSLGGHPSDVLMPIFAAAEHANASGRDFLTAVVLGYEFYLRLADAIKDTGADSVTLCIIGTAAASARLMGLTQEQISHAIAMAAVTNNILKQVRTGHLSMWKAVAAGHAGRAGVFAAMMARENMEGPNLPFEGRHGWCAHIAGSFKLAPFGDANTPFKIHDTMIKPRASCATTISSILAAEQVFPQLRDLPAVKKVTVEVYESAKRTRGTGEHLWDPRSPETADHSIPYVVSAALIDGTVTPRQFDEAHLWDPALRALIRKVEVVENAEFTNAYNGPNMEHRTRVTVELNDGRRVVGESGGDKGDISNPLTDAEMETKFRGVAEDQLGRERTDRLLAQLWDLDKLASVAEIPGQLALA